mgnify:CR=1 FL=1
MQASTSRHTSNIVYLTKDETTPFGAEKLGHNGGKKRDFFVRFEFGYYNYVENGQMIIADPEQLKRVINNIIGNSLKYSDRELVPNGGKRWV